MSKKSKVISEVMGEHMDEFRDMYLNKIDKMLIDMDKLEEVERTK